MRVKLKLLLCVALISAITATGCGHWPANLETRHNIAFTSKNETYANVSNLQTEDFPALEKFHRMYEVFFDNNGGTDEKLGALAAVGLTNLHSVVFTDCPLVTDKGVEYLSRIPSITDLGLRGTSVTDSGCEMITSKMRLRGINVSGSTNLTVHGLLRLAQSDTIEELGFSLGNLTQADVMQIIVTSRHVNRIEIDIADSQTERLDAPVLRKAATMKNIRLFQVRHVGVDPL